MEEKCKKLSMSKGVMLLDRYPSYKHPTLVYRIACDCKQSDHDLTVELEFIKEDGEFNMSFYKDLTYSPNPKEFEYERYFSSLQRKLQKRYPKIANFLWGIDWKIRTIREFGHRFKDAFKIIFNGRLKTEGWLVIYDQEVIENFIKALQEGMEYLYSVSNSPQQTTIPFERINNE